MKTKSNASPVRIDTVLSIVLIAVALGCTGYGALASLVSPLAA